MPARSATRATGEQGGWTSRTSAPDRLRRSRLLPIGFARWVRGRPIDEGIIVRTLEPGPHRFTAERPPRCEARQRFGVGCASRSAAVLRDRSSMTGVETELAVASASSSKGGAAGAAGAARETRVRLVVRKDLEGERSPGRRGRLPVGNDRADATDSMAEQGLEADVPDLWSIEGRLWQRRRSEVPNGIGGNGKGATATATWCGCCRGESFEGCEIRRGEGVGTPDGTWIRPGVGQEPVSRETRRTP
jgi:hypothetical protein